MSEVEYRICKTCAGGYPLTSFKIESSKTGRRSLYCATCRSAKRREIKTRYKANHPDRVKEQSKRQNKKNWANLTDVQRKERRDKVNAWIAANKERHDASLRAWREAHKDRVTELAHAYRAEKGREYFLALGRKSYHKNREDILVRRRMKRAEPKLVGYGLLRTHRIRHSAGKTTKVLLQQKLEYYGYRCRYCSVELTRGNLQFDHAIPLARGGSSWTANMMPSCKRCNNMKYKSTFLEFLRRLECLPVQS